MDQDMYELQKEFQRIKNMGYVKGCFKHRNCAGVTFERLLGKESDELPFSDYNGIELKTKKGYSKSKVGLFTANPDGKYVYALQNLYEKYGRDFEGQKKFCLEIKANEKHFFNSHFFKLDIDYKNREVVLQVYDINGNIIDDDTRWSFDLIKERLEWKLKKLALIKCCTRVKDNQEYYWYYKIIFYREINFDKFIDAIRKGMISIKFTIGTFKSGKRLGELHNHGTNFSIEEKDLAYIYSNMY